MSVVEWVLQVVVFFVVLKLAQILFWNVRRVFYVHPWVVELVVAVVAVSLFWTTSGWGLVAGLAILLGLIRGDQEEETAPRRELM